jgi:hypothetical protein
MMFNNALKIATLGLGLVAMLCLSACVKNQIYTPATYADDSAMVYLFRPNHAFSRGNMLRVYVNETRRDNLLNNAYLPLEVKPGKVTLKLMTDEMLTSGKLDSLELNVQKGETYYVKAKPGVFGAFSLILLGEDEGSQEIKDKYLYEQ